jgi:tetratricopeptide (TPR) repeat protein
MCCGKQPDTHSHLATKKHKQKEKKVEKDITELQEKEKLVGVSKKIEQIKVASTPTTKHVQDKKICIKEVCRLYDVGKEAFDNREFGKAYVKLTKVYELSPEFYEQGLHFMLGYLYEKKNMYDKAIFHYNKEIVLNKNKDDRIYRIAVRNLARVCHTYGCLYKAFFNTAVNMELNYYNCRRAVSKLKAKEKQDVVGLKLKDERQDCIKYFSGLCYYLLHEYDKAIAEFKGISRRSDMYWKAIIRQAGCYYKKGMYDVAARLWDKVYANNINRLVVLCELGCVYVECGLKNKLADAIAWCSKAADKRLSWLYCKNNELDKAKRLIEKLKDSEPEVIDKWGRYKDTQYNIDVEYTTRFYNPVSLQYLSEIYFNMAIKYYNKYLELSTKNKAKVLYQIGMCYLLAGDVNNANVCFQQIQHKNIKDMARVMLAVCRYKSGEEQVADRIWSAVLARCQRNYQIRSLIGYVYARLGINLDDAVVLCDVSGAKRKGRLSWNLGMVYFCNGIHTGNQEMLVSAMMCLEKNHIQESGYNPQKNKPLLLIDMANVSFNQKLFAQTTEILFALKGMYPEVEQILNAAQSIREMWNVIKWQDNIIFQIKWYDMWL